MPTIQAQGYTINENNHIHEGLARVVLWAQVNGRQFVAVYEVTDDEHENQRRREACLEDIDWFIKKFWFYGCGGYEHRFPDAGEDIEKEYSCVKCGALKKKNMDLKAVLAAGRLYDQSVDEREKVGYPYPVGDVLHWEH